VTAVTPKVIDRAVPMSVIYPECRPKEPINGIEQVATADLVQFSFG
jgi:hypothetical protein